MRVTPKTKGIIAGFSLLGIFFISLIALNSFDHALDQFQRYWYFILILSFGFGLQFGLYSFVKKELKAKSLALKKGTVIASGGLSGGSMVACCLHHLSDILPILGISVLSAFLLKYQIYFFGLGIVSNLIGLSLILNLIYKNNLMPENENLKKITIEFKPKKILNYTILIIVIVFFIWLTNFLF